MGVGSYCLPQHVPRLRHAVSHGHVKTVSWILSEHDELVDQPLDEVGAEAAALACGVFLRFEGGLCISRLRSSPHTAPAPCCLLSPPPLMWCQSGDTALLIAAGEGQEEVVELLLSYRAKTTVLSKVSTDPQARP